MSDAVKYRIFYLSTIYQSFSSLKTILFNKSLQRVQRVWLVYFVIQQNLIENLKTKYTQMNINVCEPRHSSYHLALIVTTSVSKWREILSGISLFSHTCKYKRIIIYHLWPPVRLIHYILGLVWKLAWHTLFSSSYIALSSFKGFPLFNPSSHSPYSSTYGAGRSTPVEITTNTCV